MVESTQLFQLAVSLGAVESLIEQPASMSHASYDPADRQRHGITDGLIRLSVGLEDFEDLQRDLDQALGPPPARPSGADHDSVDPKVTDSSTHEGHESTRMQR